jgi:hypothetical protein
MVDLLKSNQKRSDQSFVNRNSMHQPILAVGALKCILYEFQQGYNEALGDYCSCCAAPAVGKYVAAVGAKGKDTAADCAAVNSHT